MKSLHLGSFPLALVAVLLLVSCGKQTAAPGGYACLLGPRSGRRGVLMFRGPLMPALRSACRRLRARPGGLGVPRLRLPPLGVSPELQHPKHALHLHCAAAPSQHYQTE